MKSRCLLPLLLVLITLAAPVSEAATTGADKTVVTQAGQEFTVSCRTVTAEFVRAEWKEAPSIGRKFVAGDFKRGDAMVASYEFWQSALDGNPRAIGSRLTVDGRDFVLLGVGAKNSKVLTGQQIWLAARE